MRWDSLFDDLAGQLDDELEADDAGVRLEAERLRRGRLTVRDRVLALQTDLGTDEALVVELVDGSTWRLRVRSVGKDWLQASVGTRDRQEVIVPLSAVAAVALTQTQVDWSLDEVASHEPRLLDRLTIAFLLRDLARRRSGVFVRTRSGRWAGTIDRVGRDHLDLAVHEPGSVRRTRDVEQIRLIAFSELVVVERAD
ncbi:hypothetical protein [Plantibacter sp. Leaf314]|uniref:hypothetical protein n=1 Tax=Plantibacter sp. Leaf314 TaxID=1736333 RepID=UPI0006FE3A90|nr:hypothetical protein [Plantibacter sp. Leaf314]KQQ50325.1 hypothetical protein ASF68_14560 [Plantibacter sp. Leaf314]